MNTYSFYTTALLTITLLLGSSEHLKAQTDDEELEDKIYTYDHPISYEPASYVCYQVKNEIKIDGVISDPEWSTIPWTSDFVDIKGKLEAKPFLNTKAKMAWDNNYFYFAADIIEPHIWATLTERDAIMFQDDDFEIFIDPDGDGHNYFEFEMNAFNAIWDLLMLYPYRIDDGRNYVMNWDIRGIKTAVHLDGTINDPSDTDRGWSVEVAIPWKTFDDFKRDGGKPSIGDQWRVDFSRVDWTMKIIDGAYEKVKGKNGKPLPENNWVWSPIGYVNMHKPEVWGYVQFTDDSSQVFKEESEEKIKWALWQMYYQVKECYSDLGKDCRLPSLAIPNVKIENYNFSPQLNANEFGFTISAGSVDGSLLVIDERAQLKKQ